MADFKSRAVCYPRIPLKISKLQIGKGRFVSVNIYSFNKHLLSIPHMRHTVLEDVVEK